MKHFLLLFIFICPSLLLAQGELDSLYKDFYQGVNVEEIHQMKDGDSLQQKQAMKELDSLTAIFLNSKEVETVLRQRQKIRVALKDTLPHFSLETLKWGKLKSSDLQEKPTVLYFWSPTSQACIETIPILNEIKNQWSEKVNFVAISALDRAAIKQFLQEDVNFHFQQLILADDYMKLVKNNRISLTLVLDKNLVIQAIPNKIDINIVENTDKKRYKNEIVKTLQLLLP